ncbi:putative MFS transporter [Hortaea werneckii]|nr:putative MFS transporter [Hortaea werneckii]KAI7595397.1 putative MFS transporter [Hortaea werneckii]
MWLPLRDGKRGYAEQTQACVGEGDENINFAAERGSMGSDKSAISLSRICNARLVGLEDDLNLQGHDYNTLLSCFYVSYVVFEIPANMAFGTAFVQNFPAACGVPFLLGVFEAGMMPGIAYYLSRWYRRSELAFRLASYVVAPPLAGAFGCLLASGILTMDRFGSLVQCQIFASEGVITIRLSLIGFATLTDRPATATWLTEEEKDLAGARVKSERLGATEVLDKVDSKKPSRGIFSPMTLATAFIFLLNNITVQGLTFFAPTIVRTIYPDATVMSQQLHTVPPYVVGSFFCLALSMLSSRIDSRLYIYIGSAPMVMVGYVMYLVTSTREPQTRYIASFLIAVGAISFGSLCNAQVSANVVSDTARSGAIGTNVMMGNVGGLIATWSFLP